MKKLLILSGAVTIGLATLLGGWFVISPSGPSYAAGAIYRHAAFGGHDDRDRHRSSRRGHRSLTYVCSDRRDRSIEVAKGFVEGFVNFTPEQLGPWNKLTQAVNEGSATIGKACEKATPMDAALSAPEKMKRVEVLLETGLSVVQRVQPAFGEFYGALSDKQKQALENLMAHRRGSERR